MKKSVVFIFIISIILLVRTAYYFAQPDLSTDHISQMAVAQNFMDGHGFSFKFLDAHQTIYYKTHIQWPPLYPFVLALVSFITTNTLIASFILQITVLLLLAVIWKKIFNLFKYLVTEEAYFYFISFLIISTSILNNINTILIIALLILSFSIYFIFAYLFVNTSKKLHIFLSSILAALLFWTHYSYYFVAFYPAVVLFILFYSTRDKTYLYHTLSSFIISLMLTSGVLIYNYITSGFINYMDNPALWDTGFFPEHLLLTDPFFLNAFFKSAYLIDYLFNNNWHILLTLIFQIASIIIFILIVMLYFRLRNINNNKYEKPSLLFIPFFVIILLNISLLLYFTLRYHEIPRPGWTHIGDARYLSSVYLSVIAIVILLVFIKAAYLNKKIIKVVKVVLIFLIFISLSINIYITVKELGRYSFIGDPNLNFKEDVHNLYDNFKLELSYGKEPVFIDNELTVRSFRISQYAGAAVISAANAILIERFNSNIVFFFILPGEEKYYSKEDYKLLDWGKVFNMNIVGSVNTNITNYNITLFKVQN